MVVAAGTGITGKNLDSAKEAFKFRMKPWKLADLLEYLSQERRKMNLCLSQGERVERRRRCRPCSTQVTSSYRQCTVDEHRGRSHHFLSSKYARASWATYLDALAPAVVIRVVHSYIDTNGNFDLDLDQRRVVAASVFHALQTTKDETERGGCSLPQFSHLDSKEKTVAIALITYKAERTVADGNVELIKGTKYAITVTPAIAIVLFSIAGLRVNLEKNWRAEEEVAALYAVQKSMLEAYRNHTESEGKPGDLVTALNQIYLFSLSKRI